MVDPRDSHVSILLSTFDGAAWLPELLRSIEKQTHEDWTLLVRDDGSTDESIALIEQAAAREPRIHVVADDLGNLGPAASFMALLAKVDVGLFAFCDQDDVWEPHKLHASVEALDIVAVAAVYTDAVVTDATGTILHESALAQRGATGEVPFGHMLINNAAIGATLLGTAELARRAVALAADEPVLMHDWWVALVAGHSGSLTCLPEPTLRWRRHGATVTGATPNGVRDRAGRRLHYLRFSISAARRLRVDPAASAEAQRAVDALAALDADEPTVCGLLRAWRRGGVRAWPLRGEASLLFSVGIGHLDQ